MKRKSGFVLMILLIILAGCSQNAENQGVQGLNNGKDSTYRTEQTDLVEDENQGEEEDIDGDVEKGEEPEASEPEVPEVAYFVNNTYFIKPVNEGEGAEKIALITIDDAPSTDKESTILLLDTLDKYNAKAIWFVNGIYVVKNPEMLKEIHDRGHIIGNHTWSHHFMKKLNEEETRNEILSLNDLIEEMIGERPVYYRAPNGANTDASNKVMKEEQMQAMNWTYGNDFALKTPEEIEESYINNLHNGANLLFHDKLKTAKAMDAILQKMSEEGYTFVLPTEVRVKE